MKFDRKNLMIIIIVLGILLIVDEVIFNSMLPWWGYVLVGGPCGWFFPFLKRRASK